MFLHPHRRRFFYQTLQRVSAANQVLYTTHSADLVSVPEFENVRLVLEDAGAGLRVAPHARDIGLVFQDARLFPHLSVFDNIAFGLRMRGVGRKPGGAKTNIAFDAGQPVEVLERRADGSSAYSPLGASTPVSSGRASSPSP